jgi:hypothetical protein
VRRTGVEDDQKAAFVEGNAPFCSPEQREATSRNDSPRSGELIRLAAKARLLERLLVGDERVLATEIRTELEALAGPVAVVVPLRGGTR